MAAKLEEPETHRLGIFVVEGLVHIIHNSSQNEIQLCSSDFAGPIWPSVRNASFGSLTITTASALIPLRQGNPSGGAEPMHSFSYFKMGYLLSKSLWFEMLFWGAHCFSCCRIMSNFQLRLEGS